MPLAGLRDGQALELVRFFVWRESMTFRIAQVKKVKWPIEVQIPMDGGKVKKDRFTAEFEIIPADEYDAELAAGDVLTRVWTGWQDVQAETGEPLEFSEEARAKLLKISYLRLALMQAYIQAASGREAARKN
jgi:hypothetical protein